MKVTTAHGILIAILAAGALTACERGVGGTADNRICTPFPNANGTASGPTVASLAAPGGEAAGVEDCLHRWSYKLAGSSDSAEQVSRAVVQACGDNLSRWNSASLNTGPSSGPQSFDLTTGRPTTAVENNYQYATGKALFYVVQARAGHCSIPN